MSRISTYEVVPVPKLADKLIGTSVGGEIEDVTYNFTLQELLNLFIPFIPANNLQGVLDFGNTATQDINLFGTITTTNLDVTNTSNLFITYLNDEVHVLGSLFDSNDFVGIAGQVLTSTGSGVEWYTLPPIFTPNLQQVLTEGNTANVDIVLTSDLSALDVSSDTATFSVDITIDGTLTDGTASVGTAGKVLSSTGVGVQWVDLPIYSATSPLFFNPATGVFSIQVANATQNGYLSSADWITFDGKQGAGNYITALTGEATATGPGSVAITLSNNAVIGKVLTGLNITGGAILATDNILQAFGKVQNQINGKQNALTLTTSGSSGAATLISDTLNVPNYTLSGLGGVPTSRTLTINGTTQDLSADRTFSVGTVTSVGLSMPSAFNVSNSPINSSGIISVTGAGLASQYIRGDGQLADFPTGGGGGGSSVSYYLNGSVNQGTFAGNTYYEMNKTPIFGAGTDFSIATNGYIAQFITDVNDPNSLLIPGGNWNLEFYFSASSGGGTPTFYIELYKYDGTTFTLIADNSTNPELIAFGTTVAPYFTSMGVPETVLLATDRLAVRIFVNNSGRTITLHTENSNLCQIITTFTTGVQSLNGLTKQTQYFGVGTTGTDFNIVSSVDTHTFNLPTASATNRGALSSANWTTFNSKQDAITLTTTGSSGAATLIGSTLNIPNYGSALSGYVPYTGATQNVVLGAFDLSLSNLAVNNILANNNGLNDIGSLGGNTFRNVYANSFVKTGGLSSQFLKADGSVDSTAYGTGSVTSVAALTLGTSGTDLSSTVANGSTTPVITLNVPTASATNRGALSSGDWTTFNSKQDTITLTTTGTSGAATFIANTLNIPQYQSVITNPVTGTGTTNYLPKFTASSTIGDSLFYDNGTLTAVGNRVSTNSFVGLVRNFNVLGTDAAVRVARYTDSYATLHPTVELLNYSDNGVYRRFYWDNFVNGDDSFAIRQRLTGGGVATSGTLIDQVRLMIFSGGNVGINTTTDAGFRLDVSGTGRFSGALTGTSATFTGQLIAGSSSSQTPASISTNSQANQPALTLYKNIFTGTGEDVFRIQSFTSGVVNVFTVKDNGATAISGALTGTSATFTAAVTPLILKSTNATTMWTEYYYNTTTLSGYIGSGSGILSGANNSDFIIRSEADFVVATGGNNRRLTIASTGAATFSAGIGINGATLQTGLGAGLTIEGATYSPLYFSQSGTLRGYFVGYSGGLIINANIGSLALNNGGLPVLIGTNTISGSSILQVTGAATFSASVTAASSLTLNNAANPSINFVTNTTVSTTMFTIIGASYVGTAPFNANRLVANNTSDIAFEAGAAERVRIISGGYVWLNGGIPGFSGSQVALQVYGQGIRSTGSLILHNFANPNSTIGMSCSSANTLSIGGNVVISGTGNAVNISSDNNTLSLGLGYQGTYSGYLGGISSALYAYSTNGGYALLNASSVWVAASDAKRKRNFETYSNGLASILGLQPKLYNMDFQEDGDEKQVGLVAQEVKQFIPKAYNENGDFIGLDYNAIIVTMVNAIKEQQAQIENLKLLIK